jgi:rubrerythrin
MKSTKYQLLEADFKALQKDIKLYRKRIEELEKEQPKIIRGTVDFPALIIEWNGFVYRRT